jgi:hypothetical protein
VPDAKGTAGRDFVERIRELLDPDPTPSGAKGQSHEFSHQARGRAHRGPWSSEQETTSTRLPPIGDEFQTAVAQRHHIQLRFLELSIDAKIWCWPCLKYLFAYSTVS